MVVLRAREGREMRWRRRRGYAGMWE